MKKVIYTTLLIVALCTIILSTGCGGGNDGISQPSSINTTTPENNDNNNENTDSAFINIKIVWPQAGIDGKCVITSENRETNLFSSMPFDTTKIFVEVLEEFEDPNTPENVLESGSVERTAGEEEASITLGPIPATKVMVRATAYYYNGKDNTYYPLVTATKPGYELHIGINDDLSVAIPYYSITLESSAKWHTTGNAHVILPDDTITITATLSFDLEDNDIAYPQEGREITFKLYNTPLEKGALIDSEGNEVDTITNVITDSNGKCEVQFKGKQLGLAFIQATFNPLPENPDSWGDHEEIAISVENYKVGLRVDYIPDQEETLGPSNIGTSSPSLRPTASAERLLTASLTIGGNPVKDKTIKFSFEQLKPSGDWYNYEHEISPSENITDINGKTTAKYKVTWTITGNAPNIPVKIKATYTDPVTGNEYNSSGGQWQIYIWGG